MVPVVITVFNRPDNTNRTLEALKVATKGHDIKLYVYSDYWDKPEDAKNVLETRAIVKKHLQDFPNHELIETNSRKNLGGSVINAVSTTFQYHERLIQIEDDIVVSPAFLSYMIKALNFYEDKSKVGAISAFNAPARTLKIPSDYKYDTFFSRRPSSWGWATWKDRWEKVDWDVSDFAQFKKNKTAQKKFNLGGDDLTGMLMAQQSGKINSWAIRWSYHFYKNGLLSLFPKLSYVDNIGFDGKGMNSKTSDFTKYANFELNLIASPSFPDKVEMDPGVDKAWQKVYKRDLRYYSSKIIYRISNLLK